MKLFQRAQRSLFGEILDWMLTPLLLLVPVSIGVTWLVAQGIANAPFDRALENNVRTLARLLVVQDGRIQFPLPQAARDILSGDDTDVVYYQVLDGRGQLLSGERDVPPPHSDELPTTGMVYLHDATMRGKAVRIGSLWVPGATPEAPHALVQVAETREKQSVLATEIIKGVLLPQFAILPLAVLLIWLALVRGIKPLSVVEARIRERRPDDLSPLDESGVPLEVIPLVSSVNELLNKLHDSIATQKRFLADAAHQLKTPLAGLRMQADLAQREGANAEELKQSLKQIGRASVRATHTVNQLLSLARAEGSSATLGRQACDLARLTIEVVREAVPRAIERRIDLGYDGAEAGTPGVTLQGNPTLLKELVRNLVDNALNYTPSPPDHAGMITARVLADPFGRVVVLQVEDNGPGIAEADRELVFEPFYRVLGNEADGSGLGLPIVREIARQHGASVRLEDAHPDQHPPGTRFSVRFELEEK
ncbi:MULTISPECIES: sensor histidine kinase [unclassified Variovorax]|uniref:sensor histidine kinase n=1 Tax=unclassified Variovorax TaxID=663243 RepID=UPI00160120FE|nr:MULTISPECIES: sensor histidine kinase [unclassified Variovorax]MBB1604300.1 histidine kinase [Variovorax sp. UMC13]MDM0090980.1 sensor histidine kinase N-terminal domain-containing protein [Variovorax sp. J22G40]MDM0149018.1 sensor histidine kinase N-terminal domain-containing protein [Variovorax sp. J2P1-31]